MARFGAIHVCINGAALPSAFKVLGNEGKAVPLARFAHCCAFVIENAYPNAETIRLDAATRMRAK